MESEILELYGPWFRHPDGRWVDAKDLPSEELMAKKYPIDPMCIDLARHMLSDKRDVTDMDRTELAEQIQKLCEDFCSYLSDVQEPDDDPEGRGVFEHR